MKIITITILLFAFSDALFALNETIITPSSNYSIIYPSGSNATSIKQKRQLPNPCLSNPCGTNGLCIELVYPLPTPPSYYCQCLNGYTGSNCLEIDECASGPCKNGGVCLNLINAFLCNCPAGFSGVLCETAVVTTPTTTTTTTTTAPVPTLCPTQTICKNNGVCFIVGSSIQCVCPQGFSGSLCELSSVTTTTTTTTTTTPTTVTTSPVPTLCPNQSICRNNGVCFIVGSTIQCICPQGFSGSLCEISSVTTTTTTTTTTPFNACNPNPCRNSGTCVYDNTGSFYGCFCATNFIGTYCETYRPPTTTTTTTVPNRQTCNPNPCRNGICVNDNSGYFYACYCNTGYTGTYCDTYTGTGVTTTTAAPARTCSPNPCYNGATCVNDNLGLFYGCFCATGYSGTYCQTSSSSSSLTCNPNPCWNAATCVSDSLGKFLTCNCKTGWMGPFCDIPTGK